jgi:ubiquinone/menaquinone biosynthesis C-methylase UbiE
VTDETQRFREARAYDGAAEVYARVNAPLLFDPPARALVAAVAPSRDARILDVGSGTGAVAFAARAAAGPDAFIVGLDPSTDMLQAARRGGVDPVVAGSLPHLPFANSSFDAVLSAFVLTHVDDSDAALADMARVLRPGGRIGVSAWAAGDDPLTTAWNEIVGRFVDSERMARAAETILPGDARFAKPDGLTNAVHANGFTDVRAHDVDFLFALSVDEYVEGREVCACGRALHLLLSRDEWHRFRADARAALTARFPDGVSYTRRVFVVTGRLPRR